MTTRHGRSLLCADVPPASLDPCGDDRQRPCQGIHSIVRLFAHLYCRDPPGADMIGPIFNDRIIAARRATPLRVQGLRDGPQADQGPTQGRHSVCGHQGDSTDTEFSDP